MTSLPLVLRPLLWSYFWAQAICFEYLNSCIVYIHSIFPQSINIVDFALYPLPIAIALLSYTSSNLSLLSSKSPLNITLPLLRNISLTLRPTKSPPWVRWVGRMTHPKANTTLIKERWKSVQINILVEPTVHLHSIQQIFDNLTRWPQLHLCF